jgi:hypothetical protein
MFAYHITTTLLDHLIKSIVTHPPTSDHFPTTSQPADLLLMTRNTDVQQVLLIPLYLQQLLDRRNHVKVILNNRHFCVLVSGLSLALQGFNVVLEAEILLAQS